MATHLLVHQALVLFLLLIRTLRDVLQVGRLHRLQWREVLLLKGRCVQGHRLQRLLSHLLVSGRQGIARGHTSIHQGRLKARLDHTALLNGVT